MSLPNSWKQVPIKKVSPVLSGGTPPRSNSRFFGGDIPWATPMDATANTGLYLQKTAATLTEAGLRASSAVKLPVGSVLMTARATVGEVVIASEPTATSQDFINFMPDPQFLNNKYLAYALRFAKPEIMRFSTGTVFAAISQSSMAKWEILLPPLLEQERIVSILEKAEEIRELRRNAQAKAREILSTLFKEMFLQHPDRDKWQVTSVGEAGDVQLGRQRSPQYQTGRYSKPYLRVANVLEDELDLSEETGVLTMDFDSSDFERYVLQDGDILLNEGQSIEHIGRAAMWRNELPECYFQNTLIRFRPYPEVRPEFALWTFQQFQKDGVFIRLGQNTSSISHLGIERFVRLKFVVPPSDLQEIFENRVFQIRTFIKSLWDKTDTLERTLKAIAPSAFTGLLTEKWREKNTILLEQQAKARDLLLAGKIPEIPEDNSSDTLQIDDLSNASARDDFAANIFVQLSKNQEVQIKTTKEIIFAQFIDTFLRVVDFELDLKNEMTLQVEPEFLRLNGGKLWLNTPDQLVESLQKSFDLNLQAIASILSNIDLTTRTEFNPNNPKHPRAYFWSEVTENSPLRIVYNAMRIAQGYSNLQTIMQTLEELNEPLEEHRIAQAIDTLESAGLINAVVLKVPISRGSIEIVFLPAYCLPDFETPKFVLPEENP
jgi:restriction endonuclease S subunit